MWSLQSREELRDRLLVTVTCPRKGPPFTDRRIQRINSSSKRRVFILHNMWHHVCSAVHTVLHVLAMQPSNFTMYLYRRSVSARLRCCLSDTCQDVHVLTRHGKVNFSFVVAKSTYTKIMRLRSPQVRILLFRNAYLTLFLLFMAVLTNSARRNHRNQPREERDDDKEESHGVHRPSPRTTASKKKTTIWSSISLSAV